MTDFLKMHGTGNDFVVIPDLDNALEISPLRVRELCSRHFGIGADGVIRIGRPENDKHGYFMDYRNADGGVAEMCGNGIRVVGKWLGDNGHAGDTVTVATRSGDKKLSLHRDEDGLVDSVTVDMGAPIGEVVNSAYDFKGQGYTYTSVSMGNPHAVFFVDDIDKAPVESLGSSLEVATEGGTNVEFVDERDGVFNQRTWERGVGETLACGTGACAVAVSSIANGMTTSPVEIQLRGGRLKIEWAGGKSSVKMTGPATLVFTGSF